MHFFENPGGENPLIARLRQLPELTTLLKFGEELIGLFRQHLKKPGSCTEKEQEVIHDLGLKLKIIDKASGQIALSRPEELLRTLRHMLYGHKQLIALNSDEKEVRLDHQARIQILLAKKLSIHRIPSVVREKYLSLSLSEMESLLTLPSEELKEAIANNLTDPKSQSATHLPGSRLAKEGQSVLRLKLTRGTLPLILEIDQRRLDSFLDNENQKQEALERFLELVFKMEKDSRTCKEILNLASRDTY